MKQIPQHLSSPLQILWWDADVFGLFVALVFLSLVVFDTWYMYVITLFVPFTYGRLKRNNARGFLKHFYYSIGLTSIPGFPVYHDDEFHE